MSVFVEVPTLAGGREKARRVTAHLVDNLEGSRVKVSFRGCLAASPSFIDEIVVQVCVDRDGELLVIDVGGAEAELTSEFIDAARRHDVTDLVAVQGEL